MNSYRGVARMMQLSRLMENLLELMLLETENREPLQLLEKLRILSTQCQQAFMYHIGKMLRLQ